MSRVAILTYHPIHLDDASYSGSDLIALERDLAVIERMGIPVRSLDQIFTDAGKDSLLRELGPATVAITFDDGSEFDFIDRSHPALGPQRSAATVLSHAARSLQCLAGARPLASTFVIASPEARAELDRTDYASGGYWTDHWWRDAARSGVLGIESHSWDHNHASIARSAQRNNERGTFMNIETEAEAEAEIARSVAYIGERSGTPPRFFGYPWGEGNDFLARDYLPRRGPELGLHAAVASAPVISGYVTTLTERWLVPRFVCGWDWKSESDLETLLLGLYRDPR
jgi:peptidoglycan/xylan/chitin deacetylase (PgdA/CDA1 family)